MRTLLLLLFAAFSVMGMAQRPLSGTITDADTRKPVPGASVFLSNTSVGTTSGADGQFKLDVPAGKYELIVSSVGYETYVLVVENNSPASPLTIRLRPKVNELESIILEPFVTNGWEKWGQFFLENFIGTSSFARQCRIRNKEVIRFRNSKKNNELTALAFEPLVIENRALGYRIRYQLENFSYDYTTKLLLYQGYPLFEEMEGSAARKRRWARNREDAYYGSMMHFMRALYRNRLAEEGFQVQKLVKQPNLEKKRVRELLRQRRRTTITMGGDVQVVNPADSSRFYDAILQQSDFISTLYPQPLPGDSIAYAIDSVTAALHFTDYLVITYLKAAAPKDYQLKFPKQGSSMLSEIHLISGRPIEVQANGSYFSPVDLVSAGYWAWYEKMATMLPFDYRPGKKP